MNNPLLEQFVQEAREGLETIGRALLQLEHAPDDKEVINALFRSIHTLKGNSGLLGLTPLAGATHHAEDLLDQVRNGVLPFVADYADILLEWADFVSDCLDDLDTVGELQALRDDRAAQIATALKGCLGAPGTAVRPLEPQSPAVVADWLQSFPANVLEQEKHDAARESHPLSAVHYQPDSECFFSGEDPLLQLRQVEGLRWLDIQPVSPWPDMAELDIYRCNLEIRFLCRMDGQALKELFRYMAPYTKVRQLQGSTFRPVFYLDEAESDSRPLSEEEHTAWLKIVETQRKILELPADAGIWEGRLQSVVQTLANLYRYQQSQPMLEALSQAYDRCIELKSAEPVLRLLRGGDGNPAGFVDGASSALAGSAPVAGPVQEDAGRRTDESAEKASRVLKVSQEKVDRLMDLIGEMVVAKNALPYLAGKAENQFGNRELAREIKSQYLVINRIAEEMQDAIMQVRMMPVGTIFQRFPRLVRDLSKKLHKQVELVLEGEDTEADKNVIERLAEPMIHILRNSLDHGIESPEARLAAGKPAQGCIRISAHQEADRVIIQIRDDGKGIDPVQVRRKAMEKSLIDAAKAESLSDADAIQLIFHPGFSTAEQVSDLSGRGVGMDVVRSAIEAVHGSFQLESKVGEGTLLQLALPLSMAVTNVMIIESSGQIFGVPMEMVVETVRVARSQIRHFKHNRSTVLRGRIVPLYGLNALLALHEEQMANEQDELAVLVLRMGAENVGIVVDEFRETVDIILKPMEGILAQLSVYSGTALLGDGTVLMVINPKELLLCL
ncbi:chemotaxis protein CheA [Aquitalea sp. ASV11]|uniref:chemotaxis protein CheA n=1 Tax=Aquitalea sp. ASV11 TaxID=2795103 RepID=UPI0018EA878B|nr:chemotaxis protein CheA [Aquitalea sp. ASV11]